MLLIIICRCKLIESESGVRYNYSLLTSKKRTFCSFLQIYSNLTIKQQDSQNVLEYIS